MTKKGICIATKNKAFAYKFKKVLEEKTNVKWADGSLPTQIDIEYEIFYIEPNPYNKLNIMTGTTYEDLIRYDLFKELAEGEYDIYVL